MLDKHTADFLSSVDAEWWPCGSRVTCDPPPTDTDIDYLVRVPRSRISDVMRGLEKIEFIWEGGSEHYQRVLDDGFSSFRRGPVNLIVSANSDFVNKHRLATAVCKRLNLQVKAERIVLFQAILYGASPE